MNSLRRWTTCLPSVEMTKQRHTVTYLARALANQSIARTGQLLSFLLHATIFRAVDKAFVIGSFSRRSCDSFYGSQRIQDNFFCSCRCLELSSNAALTCLNSIAISFRHSSESPQSPSIWFEAPKVTLYSLFSQGLMVCMRFVFHTLFSAHFCAWAAEALALRSEKIALWRGVPSR